MINLYWRAYQDLHPLTYLFSFHINLSWIIVRTIQHAIVSVHPIIDISDEELTFMAPDLPELNEFYGRNYHFIWNKVRIEADGVGIVIGLNEEQLKLHAIKVQELIEKMFSVYGMQTKLSQTGL